MELAKCLQEGLLRYIFGLVAVAQEVRGSSNQTIAVPLDDQGECRLVAFPTPGYPSEFIAGIESRCGCEMCVHHRSFAPDFHIITQSCRNANS